MVKAWAVTVKVRARRPVNWLENWMKLGSTVMRSTRMGQFMNNIIQTQIIKSSFDIPQSESQSGLFWRTGTLFVYVSIPYSCSVSPKPLTERELTKFRLVHCCARPGHDHSLPFSSGNTRIADRSRIHLVRDRRNGLGISKSQSAASRPRGRSARQER
jgi:hypothetical protein